MNEIKLYKKQARQPYDKYHDFVLSWTYEGKTYECRVMPVFANSVRLLMAVATPYQNSEEDKQNL